MSSTNTDAMPTAQFPTGGEEQRTVAHTATVGDVINAYYQLTKPRIILLLLITTLPAMFLAQGGIPPLMLVLVTMVGGALAAGSANALNNVLDRDIDEQMRRTKRRPLPRHQAAPLPATIYAVVLGIASTLILGFGANWLSGFLALGANAFYVLIYTMVLKRRTDQNIVWGGLAGCFPPLIGWTAVTGQIALAPIIMFAIVFFWTPPHTWALAIRYREDYAKVNVPMMPVVRPDTYTTTQMLVYTVLMVATSVALWPIAPTGPLYLAVAAITGAVVLWEAIRLWWRARQGLTGLELKPMRLFHFSNTYLALLFVAMAIDPLIF